MEDVLDVYARPYDAKRPLVCLDEASKELHGTPRGTLPLEPDQPQRQDYEYERNGVCNLFLAIEPLRGRRKVRVTNRRTAQDFAEQLRVLVDEEYADADVVVLVLDNLNTHSPACLYERFEPATARRIAARLEWHYTPEHGSWLNIAERELSVLASQCLSRRIPDRASLIREVTAWARRRNAANVSVDWQFTAADARMKLKRLCPVPKEQTVTQQGTSHTHCPPGPQYLWTAVAEPGLRGAGPRRPSEHMAVSHTASWLPQRMPDHTKYSTPTTAATPLGIAARSPRSARAVAAAKPLFLSVAIST
jgi:hypothetical protein